MKKNLKKVISSLVALALSLSSVAAFAASYSDVPATESYATAVSELSALKVINGYDDGTFKPDAKVNRAEVTKMVVAALGQTSAAESSKSGTIFTDVAADHWASGFINVGVNSKGFINGMGDGTFNPDGNVTYAQLVKMLVVSLNYGGMAAEQGGYPTGYMAVADSIGMTKGVSGINANDELTRAQVAVLIDNAVKTPLLVNTVWSTTNPEWEVKDGEGEDYQTLLTEVHKAYSVEGRVSATNKSTGGTLDSDKVDYKVEVAKNFDGESYKRKDDSNEIEAYIGDTDADQYLLTYSTAIIQKNDDDEYTILSINPSGKNTQTEKPADAFDDENKNYKDTSSSTAIAEDIVGGASLYYYENSKKSGTAKTYKLGTNETVNDEIDGGVGLYVNGVDVGFTVENVKKYLVENTAGTVTLLDVPMGTSTSTDGKYDYIFVTYALSGVVDTVSGSKNRVTFKTGMRDLKAIELDDEKVEDGDLVYHITLDGKEIKASEIQEDDVLSINYDVTANFVDSSFYEIIVTRGTVEGQVTTLDSNEGYQVGDNFYKPYDFAGNDDSTLKVGTTYELYVDAYNRIIDSDESASTKKIAVLENAWKAEGDSDYKAKIILPDGTEKTYILKDKSDLQAFGDVIWDSYNASSETKGDKNPIQNRVVEYKLNSSQEISLDNDGKALSPKTIDGDYNENNTRLGGTILNDNVKILDVADYIKSGNTSDIDTVSVSTLVDGNSYVAYAFDKVTSDNSYRFVIVEEGVSSYSDDTQVAVFNKEKITTDENGDAVKGIEIYFDGKKSTYNVDPDYKDSNDDLGLSAGDVILVKVNGQNQVTEITTVFDNNLSSGYDTFRDTAMAAAGNDGTFSRLLTAPSEWDKDNNNDTKVELVFGPIVAKNGSSVTVARPINGKSDAENDKDYSLSKDAKIYVYDYAQSSSNRLYEGTTGDIVKSDGFGRNPDSIDWTDADVKDGINFAFMKVNDDNVEQVLVILSDN